MSNVNQLTKVVFLFVNVSYSVSLSCPGYMMKYVTLCYRATKHTPHNHKNCLTDGWIRYHDRIMFGLDSKLTVYG